MNRREFTKRISLFSILLLNGGVSLLLSGCSVFTDILRWVPVGEAALDSILAILAANGVPVPVSVQTVIQLIRAGFTSLVAAVKEYQSATPPPQGALAKIEEAFKAITDNFSTFLAQLGVSGGLLAVIAGIAQIVFSTIAAFVNQLPTAARKTMTISTSVRVGSKTVPVVPRKRSKEQFVHDVDAVLDAGKATGVTVPQSAYLH